MEKKFATITDKYTGEKHTVELPDCTRKEYLEKRNKHYMQETALSFA